MGSILAICKEPTGLTKIVYQCNLNFHIAKHHLQLLTDAGLINVSGADQISYSTTPKGMQALERISKNLINGKVYILLVL